MEPNNRDKRTKEQLLPPPQPYPWLLYFNGKGKKSQTFCSISDTTKTYPKSIPELGAASLWTVQHGWCLFANNTELFHWSQGWLDLANKTELFLWNPSNLQKIKLPPLKQNGILRYIIFSCSPTATDQVCSIFLFFYSTIILYCELGLGEKQWTKVDYSEDVMRAAALEGIELEEDDTYLTNPVYCNGFLYAESELGSFLVVIEKLQPDGLKINSARVLLPESMFTSFDITQQLLESNGELFRIEISHAQGKLIRVVVHRLNFSGMVWEKVESIKDRVFFISNNPDSFDLPFVCPAMNPETEGGRVYITLNKHNFVYIYNIEDKSIMISQPFSNLPNKHSSSRWFMPDLRMTGPLKEEGGQTQISSVDVYSKEMVYDEEFALPRDMVEKIAKHLSSIDCLRHFRATSRLFRVAAPLMLVSRLSMSPLLVSFEKDSVLTMAHPTLKYKYNINLPEDFQGNYEICYSKYGWLLLAGNKHSNIFFNPFTREVKQLADEPLIDRNIRCVGFSHPPTSSECVIVHFEKIALFPTMVAEITYPGKGEWDSYSFEGNFPLYNISPTYYKGEFYYISQKGKLGVLEVGEGEAGWEELDEPKAPGTGYYNSFLVECNGSLLSIFEGAFGKWVRVFKLNESTMTWIKVESLGNHMIFVGNTSLSAVANIPGMENKIYFPRFYDQNIVFYSLETKKYCTFKNEVVNFHDVREQLNSSWIDPKWN